MPLTPARLDAILALAGEVVLGELGVEDYAYAAHELADAICELDYLGRFRAQTKEVPHD